jgi:hypothetical protein
LNSFDPEKAARVWQRVQAQNHPAPPPPIREDRTIPEMIRFAQELADDYRRLALRYTNPERSRLLQLSRQSREGAEYLRRLMLQPPRNKGGRP